MLAAARSSPTSLRVGLPSSFVGRESALEAIDRALADGARLVTLVGPPGIGKTRLAARYAETLGAKRFDGGTWFCDLTPARDAAQAQAAVWSTVGAPHVEPMSGAAGGTSLAEALADREALLLVLDNFEQLVEYGEVVVRWCVAPPAVRLLITSRERLRVPGEVVVELGSLGLPAPQAVEEEIATTESVRLFVDRARAAGAVDAASFSDAKAIGALMRALDGIPLAIELAAARARALAPAEMLARLTQRFEVLKTRGREDAGRHATLERAVDWSWELLLPWEKETLAQSSVFEGGFTLEAAEAVVDLGAFSGKDVASAVEALCDKSLVTVHTTNDKRRFGFLVSIRDYAAAKLSASEGRAVMTRHAAYYLGEAERLSARITGRADPAARQALLSDQENVASVYRHAAEVPVTPDRAALAVRAVLALYPALESRGPIDELLRMLDHAAVLAETPGVSRTLLARVLCDRGNAYGFRGKLRASITDLDRALAVAEAAGDPGTLGETLVWLSVRYRHAGRFTEALRACDRAEPALALATRERMTGLNLAVRGRMRGELGHRVEARADNERAMAIFRSLGDRWYEGLTLANLAQLDMESGDLDSARWYYDQALVAFREVEDLRFEGRYLGYLACLDWEEGKPEAARARLEDAVRLVEKARTFNYAPLFRAVLGGVLAVMGDVDRSLEELDRAATALAGVGVPAYVAATEAHRGQLDLARARRAAARGDAREADRLRSSALARASNAKGASSDQDPASGRSTPLIECSDDVRFAVRMLQRSLEAPSSGERSIVVGPEARWFSVGADKVDLQRRAAIRLVLMALARHRLDAPGAALRQEAILRAGWPGERVLQDAGSKRVRVAISTLRKLGLEDVIVTRDDGYLLDPSVGVRFPA